MWAWCALGRHVRVQGGAYRFRLHCLEDMRRACAQAPVTL